MPQAFLSGAGAVALPARPAVSRALDRLTHQSDSPGIRGWLEELAALQTGPDLAAGDYDRDAFGDPSGGGDPTDLAPVDDDLAELGALAAEYLRYNPSASTTGFVSWLEASLRSDPPRQAGDAVDVMTFHRAKGLEWRVVFVTGLEDGLVPIAHARTTEAVAEERRFSMWPAPAPWTTFVARGHANDPSQVAARFASPRRTLLPSRRPIWTLQA